MFLEWVGSDSSTEQALNVVSTFNKALDEVVLHPDTTIASLSYFSERNKNQVWSWNATPFEEVARCVHEVILDQVSSRPNAEAICAWDGSLSYSELGRLSTQLSEHLVEMGVGPEVLVPLCFDKSLWTIVAMLGVMKAGGAFVPLDPSHPLPRLCALAHNVGAEILLCSRQHARLLTAVADNILPVDLEMIDQLSVNPDNRLSRATSNNAAYVIFTSGTTGEPKGTVIEHGAFCSSAKAHGPAMLMNAGSRVLQFAAHTFDASLVEMLTTLMIGGCVCIPSEEARLNNISAVINEMHVNWAVLTPSFVRFMEPSSVPGLKTLVLAGEAMSQSHINTWSTINLVNGYGPSECAVAAVVNSCVTRETAPTNIGRPVGVHCWIVDPFNDSRLVPVGCVGELLIEGPTLARGYLNDKDKTSQCFIQDPAWALAQRLGGRRRYMYKTGDLVRHNLDGTLNFVGRKDTQVKFNGQRIELGEIEHHLNADPNIKHGLVLLPKSGHCRQRLISVLSLSDMAGRDLVVEGNELEIVKGPVKATADSLVAAARERLSGQLPAYMVPSTWMAVGSIPLLTSGKLDRKRVATWVDGMSEELYHQITFGADTHKNPVRDATDVESKLRVIWSYVLNLRLDQIGLHRSFLSLGGDSISAMQVMGQCQKKGLSLTVQEILRSKSITDLARCTKAIDRQSYQDEVLEQAFNLSPIQQLYFQLPNQGHGHFNQSFFLRITSKTHEEDLRRAIETIITRHSMLRARFSQSATDKTWQQRVTQDVPSSYRFRTHDIDAQEEVTPAIADSQTCLDATNGPMFAVDLFNVNASDQLIFMVGHHLVIDLVSWRVILEDLEELLKDPRASLTDTKPLPFQMWCRLQEQHCHQLSPNKLLPIDSVPPGDFAYWGMGDRPNTYGDVVCDGFELDSATTSLMLMQCHNALRTEPVDILLSALISSFGQVFPNRTVPAVYNEGHGREPWDPAIDLSRTVGWFTVMYPVHVPASTLDDLVETVRLVKDLRRRVPDNGRPYFASRFLTTNGKEKFSHHWPLEVTFNYLGQYQQLEREGALLTPVEEMAGEARGAGGTADVGRDTPRFGLFEISAVVVQGKVRFSFTFNRYMRHQDTIRRWISTCAQTLRTIAQRLTNMAPEPTLSDFPLLSLTYDRLRTMVSERLPQIGVSGMDAVEDVYPCSPMQQGLLLSQTKNSAQYTVQVLYDVIAEKDDRVDTQRLADAWQKVVNRHAALRTIFIESVSSSDGLYDQIVLKNVTADLVRIACENNNEALSILGENRLKSYDDRRRPPHRFTICQTTAGKVLCQLEISHAIMDGTSMSVLFQDLRLAYEDQLPEGSGPLYSNYIAYLQSQPFDAGIEYWKSYLKDLEPCYFPVLNDGVSAVSEERQLRSLRVDFKDYLELQNTCDANGVTFANLVHTAWALTLRCYTGSEETCFGYLTSGRDAPIQGVEDAVGPFINTIVCRVSMTGTTRLHEILHQVQRDYMESSPYRHSSLGDVQHALRLSGTALFNTALSYRKLPTARKTEQPGIRFSESAPAYDPTEYDVSINVEVSEGGASVDLDYWTDCLSDGQAANVASTFVQSLQNITYHSEQTIGQLNHLSDRDRQQIQSWNSMMPDFVNDCVHNVIGQQTQSRPDAAAICAWDANFTYAELDELAGRLAHHLVTLGVGPETFVPTCFDKSAWTVVAMLAVLKAGGACVPLDATHPRSALETRVRDTQARIVVASPKRADTFKDIVPYVVAVDLSCLDQLPIYKGAACTTVQPINPCFVIYTSGSTGQPKGVVLEHRAITTSANAHGSVIPIGPDSRVLQFAAYTFDNSLAEIFTTLMRGGCVCVPSDHDRMNNLAKIINQLEVNLMDLTPTVASFLQPSEVPIVKTLGLGGEPVTKAATEVWGKAVSLYSCYGPSECSINCTWNGQVGTSGEPTNIGRAIGSVSWLVDPWNYDCLMPVGCIGELLIEGPILARGYLNDKEKTSKSFIEDPAWAVSPQTTGQRRRRMYRTGDLVRYNSDGTLTFIGRKDTQVKLNGQRIELGEIEYHLQLNLPTDAQSAVELVTTGNHKTTKALAAFLYLPSDSEVHDTKGEMVLPMSDSIRSTAKALEVALTNALPAYMVPSLYIPAGGMPMTSSGKLDRRRLRTICQSLSNEQAAMYRLVGKSGRAPSTEMEKTLQELWHSILHVDADSIGADDSFFRLGGDSVGAMRLVTAARSKGILLTVANIFQKPKLFEMSRDALAMSDAVQSELKPFVMLPSTESVSDLIEEVASQCNVERDSVQDMYPCTAIQKGLIALSSKQPGAYVAQNIYHLQPGIDLDKFRSAWEKVVEVEVILRTRIVYTKSLGFLQVVIQEPITWHNAVDLQEISEENRQLPAHNGGRLTQYTIVGENTPDPHFIWTAHHALYDGWSIPLILQRVEACYHNSQSEYPVTGASFRTFIKYLSEINSTESENFWRSKLSETTAMQFPQLPHPAYQVRATSTLTHAAHISREAGTEITIPSTIRAAWALVVAIYSGSDDVVLGETMTGRDAPVPDIADIIGPTLATIPTRIRIDRELSVSRFLRDVQQQSAQAMPYQYIGLQNIKRLSPDTAMACDFQNLLAIDPGNEELADSLCDLRSSGTVGTNFHTYPLTISCKVGDTKVDIEAHYDQGVMPLWQVQRLLYQFETILKRLTVKERKDEKLGDLEMLSVQDKETIWEWNSKPLDVVNKCIHHIIEEQVFLRPETAEAICSWDGTFTYRELDGLATSLAHHLVQLGVGPEVMVPFCFEKSAWTIIAILAILKAGGAFVPLDPTHPAARLQGIVSDLKAGVMLCSTQYQKLCETVVAHAVVVDRHMIDQLPVRRNALPSPASNNAAYVIFTSGTTGKPKGTIVEHAAFCTSSAAYGSAMKIDSTSRALQFASYTFDASLIETLTTLSVGGCICIPSDMMRLNNITGVINEMKVNWAILTPSFVQLIQPSAVPGLETLVLGGEAMSQSHILTWSGKVRLINGYGPSECAVATLVNSHMSLTTDPANLGRAVGGRCWITDKHNHHRLAPIGSAGELLIEGPVLARGYLNNDQKTAESFIQDLNWVRGNDYPGNTLKRRMYKTGDLVKYASDGTMIFLGRKDTQVKLHGQRLELGEVEHHLKLDPVVQHALVTIPGSGYCEKRLVAVLSLQELATSNATPGGLHLVVQEAAAFYLSGIRERLCDRLPAYMIPSKWVVLQELPLLPSGKLDRKQVITWVEDMNDDIYRKVSDVGAGENSNKIPETGVERQLQSILSHVLNLSSDQVGLNQSFLHLGGDSISAMQVMSRCREENIGVTVQDIIRSKSIVQLASLVTLPEEVSYQDEETEQVFDLSPIQQLYFECVGDNWTHFNQSVLLRLTRKFDSDNIARAVEAIATSHSMLRARFSKDEEGIWRQRIGGDIPGSYQFRIHSTSSTTDDQIQASVEESQTSLDIQDGPLFAVDLFNIEGDDCQLVSLVAHHLVIDVVSWRIVLQDLEDILGSGGKSNGHSSLPFQTWCRLQAEQSQQQIGRRVLEDSNVPVADMTYWGMSSQPNVYGDTQNDEFELDAETSVLLLGACHEALGTEPVDIFLAAVIHSFRQVFDDRPVAPAIYNEGHGREPWESKLDLSRTVGWFTTLSPVYLPTTIEGDDGLLNTIRWIKDLRRRMPGKGRPYFAYRLLTTEGRERFAGHWPMEMAFNYLGQYQQLERKDALLQPVNDLSGQSLNACDIGRDTPRFALFEISAAVTQGSIKFSFSYNRHMKRQVSIRQWVTECHRSLQAAAARLVQLRSERTMSDFPLLPLTYNGMAKLTERLPQIGVSSLEEVEDAYPCSAMQQGLLLSQLKNPEYYAYQLVFEVRSTATKATVETGRLAEAWQAVVRRHPMLRTVFIDSICQDGLMDQAVIKQITARTTWLECDEAEALAVLTEQQPINCREVQPPHQLTLCKTSRGRVFCKLEISHAVSDGTSMPILLRDLAQAYEGRTVKEETGPLYSDYLAYVQSGSQEGDLNYWKAYLADIEPCHFPPLNDGGKEFKKLQSLDLNLTQGSELQAFCTKNGLTLSNVLQLVWALVLRCYTGSDEVCFGYLASGRDVPVPGIQDAVGVFINMLICRMNLMPGVQLSQALKQVQADYVNSMTHQHCSLADVQHELRLSGTSLFNTAFSFQRRSGSGDLTGNALLFDVLEAHDPSEYSITINAEAWDSAVLVHLSYWTDSLTEAQASNIASTFDHILTNIIRHDNDNQTIGELNFFSEHSRRQVLSWNTKLPKKVDKCVHQIIEEQALLRPSSTLAVCAWDANLTYTELDESATRLAVHLKGYGVGPGTSVPLCFEKSAWAVVAMLGIMKAGGAFVPLDPSHPASRLKGLIENVRAKLVLCSPQYQEKASGAAEKTFVVDSKTISQLPNDSNKRLSPVATPRDAAYIIFTSGTTGVPKGTVVEHAAFCTGATEHSQAIRMRSTSRVLQFASYTFDASIMEILTTLIVGGCVCVPSDQQRMNGLPDAINNMGVNWTLLTPSVASTIKPESVPGLKVLVTGGEAMSAGHIGKWSGRLCLINAYGPSECSVIASTSMKLDEDGNQTNDDPANIGRAVGSRCWIVDPRDHNQLMPVGSIGELVVEGPIVARGYLNDERKTANAFISNPRWIRNLFRDANEPTERMYKTGDLVRYNSDGTLKFVSRKDTQIKLNGQRIELGEIEHHVKLNLFDSQAAVELIAPASRVATKALAVFFHFQTDVENSTNSMLSNCDQSTVDEILLPMSDGARSVTTALEASLAQALPTYMIPSFYVPVSRMPWTSSGKLDRQRLRNMVQTLPREATAPYRLASSTKKRAPATEMEKKLQRLWGTVLNLTLDTIGADDSFFRLGGDSVAAMRLVSAARSERVSLTVIEVFRKPKLSEMAGACGGLKEDSQSELKPFSLLKAGQRNEDVIDELADQCQVGKELVQDAYPCTSLQEGLITLSIKQPGAYVAQNVFRLPASVDIRQFQAVWQKTVEEVDILRTRIVHMRSSAFAQVVLQARPIVWHEAKSLDAISDEMMELPAHNGGPLTRYTIIDGGDVNARYFVWFIHHALYDGWSMSMVLKRVENIYFSGMSTLPKISYARFIKYTCETDAFSSDEFWKGRLLEASPVAFPRQLQAASDQPRNSQILTHTANLSGNVANMNVTMSTIIRAGWSMVVAAYSGSDDIVFGESLMGRDVPVLGIMDMIGPTLTTVPTRVQIDRGSTIMHFLQTVHQMAAEVIPYQHAGLQHIKRLNLDTSVACDFQNLLVIQTAEEDSENGLLNLQSNGAGTNFFTYPLVLECKAGAAKVEINAYHDENVISGWQVQRLLCQFSSVLKQLSTAKGINRKLGEVEISSPQDQDMVRQWNCNELLLVDKCFGDLFEQKVVSQPEAPAVCAWDGDFTYREVNEHAARLAHHLMELGVGPEVLVPICLDKSAWAIVAILGVLLAGGAFVPLDPAHPISRHDQILRDTKAKLLLCSPQYSNRYHGLVDKTVSIDGKTITQLSTLVDTAQLSSEVMSKNAAYVIFTSGSTGQPKGVVIEHRALCTSSLVMSRTLNMKPTSRVFQFASYTFDASILEVLTTFTCGGCVCVPSDEGRLKDVGEAINRLNASWSFLTPSVANIIEASSVPSLEVLVVGGEAVSSETIRKWADHVSLHNGYGPAEATVLALTCRLLAEHSEQPKIGRALGGGYSWIVDPLNHNHLAPVGAVGELLLEGPILAREYLNDEHKTAQAFVENPTWIASFTNGTLTPRRMYKTGDLVKYSPDGSIIFIGRKDNQVKFHGQRIELGEIEHRLEEDPHIRHALVVMPKSGSCKQRLVAVISLNEVVPAPKSLTANACELVPEGPQAEIASAQMAEARNRLSDQLPPYMVPVTWVVVETIPLLVSGKLDRKRVAHWIENIDEQTYKRVMDSDVDDDHAVPATVTGRLLQQIWSRALNLPLESVKLNQSFLNLGGDSITAMQVMALSRKERINLSMHEVLRSKSITQLALCAGSAVQSSHQEEKIDELFDLSPIQQLYFQCASTREQDSHFNQSFSLRLTRQTHAQDLSCAVETIVNQHSMLRARFTQNQFGIWQQRITREIVSSYRYRVHYVSAVSEIVPIVTDSQTSLNIREGPLFAVDLFDIEGDGQMLFLVAHHLVIDMVSWRIILQDLEELLDSRALTLDKPLSFQTWCAMQTDDSRQRSASSSSVLPFEVTPTDLGYWGMVGQSNTYSDVECDTSVVNQTITKSALGRCHKALRTEPVDLFLSALAHSFSRVFLDRATPTIFNEGHGREPWDTAIDPSRTVGWFTSICPVHVTIGTGKDDVVETVRQMKDIRRLVPDNGRSYFAHCFLTPEGQRDFRANMPLEIVFNYLGRMQQLENDDSLLQKMEFTKDAEEARLTADVGPNAPRFALFEISAVVVEDKMQFSFMYNRRMHHQEGIRRWIVEFQHTLEETVKRLTSIQTEPTLSDFPLLPLSYDGLRKLITATFPGIGISHPDQVEDVYPCAPMQEGLLLSQLKDAGYYLCKTTFEVKPMQAGVRVNGQRLARAWQKVVDRHAALRTVFVDSVCRGGIFDQIVVKDADSGVIRIQCNDSEVQERLSAITLTETNHKKKPRLPHQLTVCETSTGRVFVKMEINHAVIDGGSTGVLMDDLTAAYEGRLPDGSGPLYRDYVAYIKSQPPSKDIKFWKKYLEGVQPCHFPRLNNNSRKKKSLGSVKMEFDRYSELQDLCKQKKVTLSNVMQAAWGLVLRTYTGSDDVCFGYLTSGRDAPINGIQDAVGAFINMLVCRIQFAQASSLEEVFKTVQNDFVESLPHQHCSLAQVQHDLDLSGKALFNTAVSIQGDSPSGDSEAATIAFETTDAEDPSEYVVTLNIRTARNDEGVLLRYWTNSVSDAQATKLASTLAQVLTNMVCQSHQTVAELDISNGQNQHQVDEQPMWGSPSMLRMIVRECVTEIMDQMIQRGDLLNYNYDRNQVSGVVSRRIAESSIGDDSHDCDTVRDDDETNHTVAEDISRPAPFASLVAKKLLSLWSVLLEMPEEAIGSDQSFFELGGDSIIAMQMVGAAREEGLSMTVADIFRHPVLADMAGVVQMADDCIVHQTNRDTIDLERNSAPLPDASNMELYQRFSLLEASNIDAFLQNSICPRVHVFRGGIIDVFPVTDFQALAITGSLLESRWMLNYFYLDGRGPLDLRQLKKSVFRLAQAFDILRTVFVPYKDRFLQVVLRKLQPEFLVYETDQDLDAFTAGLQQKDREHGPRLGESYFQFTIAKEKSSDRHRMFMRILHAQYDGVCLPRIFAALQAGYQGLPIPSAPSFSSYVRDSAKTIIRSHFDYWKTLLDGSSMTDIISREGPKYKLSTGTTTTLKQVVPLVLQTSQNITPATLIKAAWSLVLAQLSAQSDIVFGHVISGRNAAVPGVESIIGPCLNIVPVRINFQSGWKVLDLLHYVQDQQVDNMPFESLGFREIIKHCTEWPDWTNFSTVVQHQNIQRDTELRLGENVYKVGAVGTQEDFADFTVLSNPQDGGKIEISLTFCTDATITMAFAEKILDLLCTTVASFSADPTMPLPSPSALSSMQPQTLKDYTERASNPSLSSHLDAVSKTERGALTDTLTRAWQQILRAEKGNSVTLQLDHSFFKLGGDIMGLAHVANILEQEGYKVRVEDLINRPIMAEQLGLLAMQSLQESGQVSPIVTNASLPEQAPPTPIKRRTDSFLVKSAGLARKMIGQGRRKNRQNSTW